MPRCRCVRHAGWSAVRRTAGGRRRAHPCADPSAGHRGDGVFHTEPKVGPPLCVVRLCAMAADIVPIRLGLTKGDLYTLWAPRWRDEGDEWEAFLGKDED